MYMQTSIDTESVSMKTKIENRLRDLAQKKCIDVEPYNTTADLSMELCAIDALSPTEFRAINYLLEIYDKVIYAGRIDRHLVLEANEIGERVVRILDNRIAIA